MEGSPYLNQRPEAFCREVPIAGRAGSFVLIHYDVWHRKLKNHTDLDRYMFKFEFTRLAPPTARAWNDRSIRWRNPRSAPELNLSPV